MTNGRFNQLVDGTLIHLEPVLTIARLVIALRAVVEATGEAGDQALEEHCVWRQRQDNSYYKGRKIAPDEDAYEDP